MPKITLLRGLPASGKSSYAREAVKSDGNTFRINRDTAREELFFSDWSGKREEKVIKLEEVKAKFLLENGLNVIVDNTHLREKDINRWKQFSERNKTKFEVKSFLDVPLEECVRRDAERENSVGKAVIHRMALFAGLIDFGDKPIIWLDLDGTTYNGRHREYLVSGEKKFWDQYFSMMTGDEPVEIIVKWVQELSKDHTICVCSGRPDRYQHETMYCLARDKVPYDYIFMRGGTKEPDTIIKQNILDHMPKEKIAFCLDDRLSIVEMLRKNRLKVYPVRCSDRDFA